MRERVTSKSLAGPSEICMLMPIRKGFADGLETRSYESRLRSFMKLFSDLRALSRESRLDKPYSDIVDRIRTIHGVTLSIIEGRLLLTVHFDQPWEPYIQVIWRELGAIFDAILCNCEGYVENHRNELGYEAFAGWIRKYQLTTNTFYMNSAHTVTDVIYLDQLERRIRKDGAIDSQAFAAQRYVTPEEAASRVREYEGSGEEKQKQYVEHVKLGVQAVSAFHALTHMYPKDSEDHKYILNAARSVLPEAEFTRNPVEWDGYAESPTLQTVARFFAVELDWFANYEEASPDVVAQEVAHDPDNVQSGISESYSDYGGVNQGCLALVQIVDPAKARDFLYDFRNTVSFGPVDPQADMYRNIGFTAQGLRRLGLPQAELDKFPSAFLEGMAARAGLIGDLRSNHPDRWTLPERNWPMTNDPEAQPLQRVNLESVDMIIQLRHRTDAPNADLAPAFVGALEEIEHQGAEAIKIVAVQPTYSLHEKREHFGFRDGLSQPIISNPPSADDRNEVPSGEVFLGYPRGANSPIAEHWTEPLFKDGTFQVVRKLAQHVDRLNAQVEKTAKSAGASAEGVLTYMMGRDKDGKPLVEPPPREGDNTFTYDADDGAKCPLWAHIRRANPRDRDPGPRDLKEQEVIPRIVRSGMSYGSTEGDGDRGLVFQCYNADLAEQFEIIQQWVAGDNRTAPYSQLSDPFLGVPQKGEARVYYLANGKKIDLGDEPFVTLRWGLYLFVPSRRGLEALADFSSDGQDYASRGQAIIDDLGEVPANEAHTAWKRLLEEKESRDAENHRAVWAAVREYHGGILRTPFGVLVGSKALIDKVLSDDSRFSVSAYKERLDQGVKKNYLGMDEPDHSHSAEGPNEEFRNIGREQGFAAALALARGLFQNVGLIEGSVTLPLPKYADQLLALVAHHWFGMPDGRFMESGGEPRWDAKVGKLANTVHCPYHFISTSRAVFQPAPSPYVSEMAAKQGRALRRGVDKLVEDMEDSKFANVANEDTRKRLESLQKATPEDEFGDALLGALLGFMPTVQGNFLETGRDWLRSGDFWSVQNLYLDLRKNGADEWTAATRGILPALTRAVAIRPVPSLIHRTVRKRTKLGGLNLKQGESIVVGLVSATAESGFTDIDYVFGGPWYGSSGKGEKGRKGRKPIHACPGRELGLGTLLAMFAGLFEAGGYLRGASSPLALQYNAKPFDD